eukprot:gene2442-2777_t
MNLADLKPLLDGVESSGSHYSEGTQPVSDMTVEVKKVTKLSLPVTDDQVKLLVASAVRAPYGKGTETIVDTEVRKVWQIDAKQVKLGAIDTVMPPILETVASDLGMAGQKIKANLYKMLVYDEGAFFLPHKDTEKENNMFATLVISLPSEHTGGDLVIRHGQHSTAVSLENADPATIRYCAFYADCEHEVKPVTKGNRVCLVYNLCRTGKRAADEKVDIDSMIKSHASVEPIRQCIKRTFDTVGQKKLVVLLDHNYPLKGFAAKKLKGRDSVIANLLSGIATKLGLVAAAAIVTISEEGVLHHDDPKPRDIPNSGLAVYDKEYTNRVYVDAETYYTVDINAISALSGSAPTNKSIQVFNGEIFPYDGLKGMPSAKKFVTQATGNEGSLYEKLYQIAAVVLFNPQADQSAAPTPASQSSSEDEAETQDTKKQKIE